MSANNQFRKSRLFIKGIFDSDLPPRAIPRFKLDQSPPEGRADTAINPITETNAPSTGWAIIEPWIRSKTP